MLEDKKTLYQEKQWLKMTCQIMMSDDGMAENAMPGNAMAEDEVPEDAIP